MRSHAAQNISTRLSLEAAEQIVGETANTWAGRCYEIACKLAEHVGGPAVYGHYIGPVAKTSLFWPANAACGFSRHGWVDLGDTVFDATRWVFEGVDPYLYEGPGTNYDEGGNRLRTAQYATRPFPADDAHENIKTGVLDAAIVTLVQQIGHRRLAVSGDTAAALNVAQWMWLANLPYDVLGEHARGLYATLDSLDLGAFVPIDNLRRAQR